MSNRSTPSDAIVLSHGVYRQTYGKVAHGLVRGSDRFKVLVVVDPEAAGEDAGELLDGRWRGIPVVSTIEDALAVAPTRPEYCVVGVATHGGRFTPELRQLMLEAVEAGLAVVNGLHDFAADDPDIAAEAARRGVELIDLRRPKPKSELHFWSGEILSVNAPRIAVLGMDCAIGKRTTTRLLVEALSEAGLRAEMIYTGQTGWMQGARYGFVLDAVVNDYVSGELEHAIVTCDREAQPEVMLIEGQSSLRNPSGPCGAELLVSAAARGVILQHAPARVHFEGYEELGLEIPSVEEEIRLISLYGSRTLAVALHADGIGPAELEAHQQRLRAQLGLPVVRPLDEGVGELVPVVREFINEEGS
ncbi:MAG: DUF1611 domain-containing protein [Acidobacteria bacterium]|nr:MAG: DUF1611 domain-containing protein [Acidobacteriota bacterium]